MDIQRKYNYFNLTKTTESFASTYVSISWGISSKSSKVLWFASNIWFIFLFSKICSADSINSVHPDVNFGISVIYKASNSTLADQIHTSNRIHRKPLWKWQIQLITSCHKMITGKSQLENKLSVIQSNKLSIVYMWVPNTQTTTSNRKFNNSNSNAMNSR